MTDVTILEAAQWAAEMHSQETRKHNKTPYIRHPQRVAARAMCLPGMSIQGVCAAWLHDVPEEVAGEDVELRNKIFDEIQVNYGTLTFQMVKELTPITMGMKSPRAERKAMERQFLSRARKESKRIKLLDRIDNLQESLLDMQRGLDVNYKFNALYVTESRLLLEEALRGSDPDLEEELMSTIEFVGKWILTKTR